MRVQLAPQAQEILGTSDLVLITERVDDVALLIGQLVTLGLPEVLDRPIPRHWRQRGLSWGWTAPVIAPLDVRADRCSPLLTPWSTPAYGHALERDRKARRMTVDDLSQDVIRWDATTVSGAPEVTEAGLIQFGQSNDDPTRPPIKVRMGSCDPLGMPLATDGVSGARADEGFYLPRRERLRTGLQTPGVVLVGDGTMSAWDTRAYVASPQDWSWSPFPLTGTTAEARDAGSTAGVTPGERGAVARMRRTNDRGHTGLAAEGDALERAGEAPDEAGDIAAWPERVLGAAPPCLPTNRPRGWTNG